jgi:hypothetical protein
LASLVEVETAGAAEDGTGREELRAREVVAREVVKGAREVV